MSLYKQFQDIVSQIVRTHGVDYAKPWACKVARQVGQLVDVIPDNPRMPHLCGIPIRTGIPGVRVRVKTGSRVRVMFDDGDPSKPFVALWDIGDVDSIDIGADSTPGVARQGDTVIVNFDSESITALATMILTGASAGAPCKAVPIPFALSGVIASGSLVVGAK